MPLHHDIVSRCCDFFNCPLPVTTLIWGTVIKMKRWSFIVTTSSVTLLLLWRCKRFFKNWHSKYNCTRASLVRISCLFVRHSYLWEFCGFEHDTNVLYDTRVAQRNNLTPDRIRARVPQCWMISYAPCFMRMENESSLSLTIFPPILTVICKNKRLNVLVWNWSCCSSEYSGIQFQIGLPCFMNSSRGKRLYCKMVAN